MPTFDIDQYVNTVVNKFTSRSIVLAEILCDDHPQDVPAYTVINGDLQAVDYSYAQLKSESEKFAAVLTAQGVQPGQRVATLMGKSWEYLVTLMGIWRAGAVHVPLFTAFAPSAIQMRLDGSDAKVVVCDTTQQVKLTTVDEEAPGGSWKIITLGEPSERCQSFQALMSDQKAGFIAVERSCEDPVIQVYTSGTTGKPKGVVVPIKALASFKIYAEMGLGIQDDDRFWCAADPGWAYGLYFGVLATFLTGVSSILYAGGFDAEKTLKILKDQKVTNYAAAPTVYRSLRASGVECSPNDFKLRCASSAGEPLTPDVNAWAESSLGVSVHDHYGQTEAGMLLNNHHHPAVFAPIKEGSMGKPMPGWTGAVLDFEEDIELQPNQKGRIVFDLKNSPAAWFAGYDNKTEKSAEKFSSDGRWFLTGDTGLMDDDGYFHFSSRDDDVIIMAGYRIGPFEVESVISSHPAVVETAVIAVPDEVRGEVIECYVVVGQGYQESEELVKDIQNWVKTRYAAHAYPRKVHFIDVMPKTPSGKIQRFALKKIRLEQTA